MSADGIAIVGCGYVFDHYMSTWGRHPQLRIRGVYDRDAARLATVAEAYELHAYGSLDELLADGDVGIVCNFTSIESHHEVSVLAIEAGRHVYSEKPLAADVAQARDLAGRAAAAGVTIGSAPSNVLGAATQTVWSAVRDGAVGDVKLVYAEFDDNPIYLMEPETWRSRTGAPWPYLHEYEQGCTVEHVGYHLTPLCAIFGPVESLTAFSKCTVPEKAAAGTLASRNPDFSVACLNFVSGVTARVTCSIAAPLDHRVRVIGTAGALDVDTYRHYECPVYLEPFTTLSLNARKAYHVRHSRPLGWITGVGGRRVALAEPVHVGEPQERASGAGGLLRAQKAREVGQQDKAAGVVELVEAVRAGRVPFPAIDFTLHVTELTHAIQNAGPQGVSHAMETSFAEPEDRSFPVARPRSVYAAGLVPRALDRLSQRVVRRLHRH